VGCGEFEELVVLVRGGVVGLLAAGAEPAGEMAGEFLGC
jgi:hypothetical protein